MNGNKPVRVFRAGAIKASVFENSAFVKGVKSTIFNVIVSKTYKDKDNNWKSTNSFSVYSELPKIILVLQKAYEFVVINTDKEAGEEEDDEM